MKDTATPQNRKMAQAEYTASTAFYNGVRKAEQSAAPRQNRNDRSRQEMHELMNVLSGRWMH